MEHTFVPVVCGLSRTSCSTLRDSATSFLFEGDFFFFECWCPQHEFLHASRLHGLEPYLEFCCVSACEEPRQEWLLV